MELLCSVVKDRGEDYRRILRLSPFRNGSSGVVYNTTGADYAEYLPRLDPEEEIDAGDIVGVFGGKVTKQTRGAHQVMVISSAPAVLGNMPQGEDHALHEKNRLHRPGCRERPRPGATWRLHHSV